MARLESFQVDATPKGLPFCSAVRVGELIFASGAIGNVAGTFELVEGGIGAETRAALEHLIGAVEAAGGARETIAKTLVFIAEWDDYAGMNEAYAAVMGDHRPARSTIAVKGLAAGARVEVECVAAVK